MSPDMRGSTVLVTGGTGGIGPATPLYLASSPEVAGVSGAYFADRRARRSSTASYDRDLARRLWAASSALVGVEWDSKPLPDTKEQT